MPFAIDAFAGTPSDVLSTYSAKWTKQTGWTTDMKIGADGQFAYNPSSVSAACWVNTDTPAGADYDVSADIKYIGGSNTSNEMGVCGRAQVGVDSMYYLYYQQGSSSLGLSKRVSGSPTSLGTFTMSLSAGTAKRILLRMAGNQISAYVDGVLRIGPVTDGAITGAGRAGIMGFNMREPGVQDSGSIDNWQGDEADSTPPTLTSPTGTATGLTTATGTVTTNEANGTLFFRATTNPTETVAFVKAGSSQAVSGTGVQNVNFTGLTGNTTYYPHYVHTDAAGNDSARATGAAFITDVTAPTLSSPTGTATGATTATGTVSTDEGNGTLYRFASTNATETAATVKAANLTQAVSGTGVQNVSFSGLSPSTTYFAHYVHRDAAGNDSARVSSSSFTTAAGGGSSLLAKLMQLSN